MSPGDVSCLLFVTSAVWWFLSVHTALAAIVLLVAGLLCLAWLLSKNPNVARAARSGLLAMAAAALIACMAWAVIELARHV